jgi:hypothetical protein
MGLPMNSRRAGILVFPEAEVLNLCGPFEVFSVTRLDENQQRRDKAFLPEHPVHETPVQEVDRGSFWSVISAAGSRLRDLR